MIKAISSLIIMLSFSLGANATEEEREPIIELPRAKARGFLFHRKQP